MSTIPIDIVCAGVPAIPTIPIDIVSITVSPHCASSLYSVIPVLAFPATVPTRFPCPSFPFPPLQEAEQASSPLTIPTIPPSGRSCGHVLCYCAEHAYTLGMVPEVYKDERFVGIPRFPCNKM